MGSNFYKIVLKSATVVLFGCAFLWRCANIVAPQGGPRDTLGPVVLSANPKFYATDFDQKRIYISFNEFIQLKDQQKEFFVSPMLASKPTVTVRGKNIVVQIADTVKLAPNTTYAFNFGNSVRDNNEGNPLNGFRYVVSTGKEIDSMFMAGYTVDASKGDSVSRTLIYFYEAAVDSIPQYDSTLLKSMPAVIAKAENNGIFIAQNLKSIDYRVYAYEDNNGNFMYDPETDKVGFLDSVCNPLRMPDFSVWYDTTRNYYVADPQMLFRMFTETRFRQQRLADSQRPEQHKVVLQFSAPNPQIERLTFEDIDEQQIITEYTTKGKDTITYWLNVPSEQLPDTVKAEVVYFKHDSVGTLVPDTAKLKLFWKYFESKEEQKAREDEEKKREKAEKAGEEYKAPVKPNTFKVETGKGEINPENNVEFTFGAPLTKVDSSQIELIRVDGENRYRVRHTFEQDSVELRKWILRAPWIEGQKYEVHVKAGTFENAIGEKNDSIGKSYTVLDSEKLGTLKLHVTGKSDTSSYVIYLTDENGNNILNEKRGVSTGNYEFKYVNPGNVRLRVLEDMNGNGLWDSGNLIERRQPERVEPYRAAGGDEVVAVKANWEIEVPIDMNVVFAPETTDNVRAQLAKAEAVRLRKAAEEREKQEDERRRGVGNQSSGTNSGSRSGGLGIGSGLNSISSGVGGAMR